jgi:hypothetical protein
MDIFVHISLHNDHKEEIVTHKTVSFSEFIQLIAITPGELYTNLEKMLLPFDDPTWLFLILTFVFAFAVVAVVSRMRAWVRYAVFGRGVATPSLNIVRSFFGISLYQLPEENSARILLAFFLYFCLVFRTAYQGVFFELMTTDPRKSSPETFEELAERNFTLYWDQFRNVSHEWFGDTKIK